MKTLWLEWWLENPLLITKLELVVKCPIQNGNKGISVNVGDGTNVYSIDYEFVNNPDDWHQVTLVYAGNSMLLYVDGEFESAIAASIANVNSRISIGTTLEESSPYRGLIDDIRIYNRPLTSSQILLSKEIAPSKNSEGLVAYFKCDEGLGKSIFDISNSRLVGEKKEHRLRLILLILQMQD